MAEVLRDLQWPGEMSFQHQPWGSWPGAVTAGFSPLKAQLSKKGRPRPWMPLLQAVRGSGSAPPWMYFRKEPAHIGLLETHLGTEGVCALLRNPHQGRNSWSGCRQRMLEQGQPWRKNSRKAWLHKSPCLPVLPKGLPEAFWQIEHNTWCK